MPYKDREKRREKQKEYSSEHYKRNKDQYKINSAVRRRAEAKKWKKFKDSLSCVYCGESHPATFDFHHIDPATKRFNVNNLVKDGRYSRAYEEAKLCLCLCANCHRKLHYKLRLLAKKKRKKGAKGPLFTLLRPRQANRTGHADR